MFSVLQHVSSLSTLTICAFVFFVMRQKKKNRSQRTYCFFFFVSSLFCTVLWYTVKSPPPLLTLSPSWLSLFSHFSPAFVCFVETQTTSSAFRGRQRFHWYLYSEINSLLSKGEKKTTLNLWWFHKWLGLQWVFLFVPQYESGVEPAFIPSIQKWKKKKKKAGVLSGAPHPPHIPRYVSPWPLCSHTGTGFFFCQLTLLCSTVIHCEMPPNLTPPSSLLSLFSHILPAFVFSLKCKQLKKNNNKKTPHTPEANKLVGTCILKLIIF